MSKSLLHFQNVRCFTSCFAVMPNHIHVVVKPLGDFELEDVLGSIKQFTCKRVNNLLDRSGKLWQQESYDQIVRDEEHLFRVIQYIGRNPRSAGLAEESWRRWLCTEWEKEGWGFRNS